MRRTNLVFLLFFMMGNLFCQQEKNVSKFDVLDAILCLPDSVKADVYNAYNNLDITTLYFDCDTLMCVQNINGAVYESQRNTQKSYLSIKDKSSDSEPTIQFVLIEKGAFFIFGVNSNSYDGVNTTTKLINFYKIDSKGEFQGYYTEALEEIDFYTNYSKEIKEIIKKCSLDYIDLFSNREHYFRFNFLEGDTIQICEAWAEHPLVNSVDSKNYEHIISLLRKNKNFNPSSFEYCQPYVFNKGKFLSIR